MSIPCASAWPIHGNYDWHRAPEVCYSPECAARIFAIELAVAELRWQDSLRTSAEAACNHLVESISATQEFFEMDEIPTWGNFRNRRAA